MSHASQPPLNPDDLNDLWDAAVDGPVDTGRYGGTAEATIIGWLQSAEPQPSRSVPALPVITERWPSATMTPQPRNRKRPSLQPIASGFLAVALVVAILFAKPVRDLWQPEGQRGIGSPTEQASDFAPGTGRSLISVVVRPGDAESSTIEVGFWDVTLLPGMVLHVPAGIQVLGNQAIEGWVEDGTATVGAGGFEHEIPAGQTTAVEPAPEYIRNDGSDEVRLLLLAPMEVPDVFPLRLAAWPGNNGASSTPVRATEQAVRMFSSVTLNGQEAVQYRVTVYAATFEPGRQYVAVATGGRDHETIHSTTVLQGEATIRDEPGAGTPEVVEVLRRGDTIQPGLNAGHDLVSSSGDENLTLLTLASTPWSENPTLDQTVAPVAPYWSEWMVPASDEVTVVVRSLAIEADGRYHLPTDAGVIYYLAEGEVSAMNAGTGATGALRPGSVVAQLPETVLSFANASRSPARLVQILAFAGSLEDALVQEQGKHVDATMLIDASGSMPPGMASMMLEVNEYNGVNDGGSSGSGGMGLTLLMPIDGAIEVRRDGGDATVSGPDEEPWQPPLGEGVALSEGGFMLVQPGGSWAVTGADGEQGTGLVLNVSPMVDTTASLATPEASPDATIALVADPGSCDVAPLAGEDVDDLMATPAAIDEPLARSGRDLAGVPADPDTAAAIVAAIQAYADCWATGTYARAAVYLSDQAIRENESMRDFIATSFEVGDMPHVPIAIEDIVVFADGRAGARVVMNGEAAYITFVVQDGQWVIDVWDDRDGGPPVNAPESG